MSEWNLTRFIWHMNTTNFVTFQTLFRNMGEVLLHVVPATFHHNCLCNNWLKGIYYWLNGRLSKRKHSDGVGCSHVDRFLNALGDPVVPLDLKHILFQLVLEYTLHKEIVIMSYVKSYLFLWDFFFVLVLYAILLFFICKYIIVITTVYIVLLLYLTAEKINHGMTVPRSLLLSQGKELFSFTHLTHSTTAEQMTSSSLIFQKLNGWCKNIWRKVLYINYLNNVSSNLLYINYLNNVSSNLIQNMWAAPIKPCAWARLFYTLFWKIFRGGWEKNKNKIFFSHYLLTLHVHVAKWAS
jgi:hypothetical protein